MTEYQRQREAAGLSLYDVPRLMQVTTVRWAYIEAGHVVPTEAEARDFSLALARKRASKQPW